MPKEGTSSFATAVLCTTTHSSVVNIAQHRPAKRASRPNSKDPQRYPSWVLHTHRIRGVPRVNEKRPRAQGAVRRFYVVWVRPPSDEIIIEAGARAIRLHAERQAAAHAAGESADQSHA